MVIYPRHLFSSSLPILSAHSQLHVTDIPFLNQLKDEDDGRSIFMTKSHPKIYRNNPKFLDGQVWAISVDPIRMLLVEQSDQGLHCLPFYLHILDKFL